MMKKFPPRTESGNFLVQRFVKIQRVKLQDLINHQDIMVSQVWFGMLKPQEVTHSSQADS